MRIEIWKTKHEEKLLIEWKHLLLVIHEEKQNEKTKNALNH